MINLKEKFIVDDRGNRIGVILDIEEYNHLLEELEELDDIREYDEAKANAGEMVPLEQAVAEIEKHRK